MRLAAILVLLASVLAPGTAAAQRTQEPTSLETVLGWINQYRLRPEPHRVPEAMRIAGRLGAFRDPETAGVYVGFLAGVLQSNPARAETLIEKILPLPPEQQWYLVRAVAYSGLPNWKALLDAYKMHMPSRAAMIDMYLSGRLATLDDIDFRREKPSVFARLFAAEDAPKEAHLEPTPDVLDTLWGIHFATGAFDPIARIVAMLPWSLNDDEVDLLTLGGMAKFTLATNASRNPELLKMLKWTIRYQDEKTTKLLNEVIAAAESVETGKLRKEALAAIEELKRKGPGTRRKIAGWGQVGQGAIALGCIGAAVAGAVVLGLPCVIGGAVTSAALNAWAAQE